MAKGGRGAYTVGPSGAPASSIKQGAGKKLTTGTGQVVDAGWFGAAWIPMLRAIDRQKKAEEARKAAAPLTIQPTAPPVEGSQSTTTTGQGTTTSGGSSGYTAGSQTQQSNEDLKIDPDKSGGGKKPPKKPKKPPKKDAGNPTDTGGGPSAGGANL
jgi:hypothetical protein